MNKDAYLRYCILDKCFHKSLKGWTVEELMKKIDEGMAEKYPNGNGITRQQLYLDLQAMEQNETWNVEFVKTKTRPVLYRYADPNYSIHEKGLPPRFRENLQAACELLHSFKGLPQLEWLSASITQMEIFSQDTSGTVIEFEASTSMRSLDYLPVIYKAIKEREVLGIVYKPYPAKAYYNIFHPCYLKQYNKRWWLFGISERYPDSIQILCLDRIGTVNQTGNHFDKHDIDWGKYFSEIIGVTNNASQQRRKAKFIAYGTGRFHIRNSPLHSSQRHRYVDDNTYEFTLNVKINYELKKSLMQYAHEIRILEPKELADEHKAWLQQALNNYDDIPNSMPN